ncbi:PiggyBac transposable element-derived protein 4 [Nymphon striatum]|nr:PiggyBac transposable element-derived protein 4 [Nymphon striatum]
MFNNNCTKYVIPSEYLVIDETLYPMRHEIAFLQYNPNKPAKYGLLFKSINDARFPFTYQATVCAGKPQSGNGPHYIDETENYIKYFVTQMEKDMSLQGRNISMDRLYTSIYIAQWLLGKRMTVVGTLQMDRIGIPDKLKSTKDQEDLSSTIYWEEEKKDMVMCTYTVKTKSNSWENVLMLSTMQPLLGITRDDDKKKPALYKFYDFTKGGTDIVDQKIGSYTCTAKSPKWKMVALYYILDTIRINATTLLALTEKQDPKKMNSFDVGWELAMSLVIPNISRRNRNGLNILIQRKIKTIVGNVQPAERHLENDVNFPKIGDKRQRCKSCLR